MIYNFIKNFCLISLVTLLIIQCSVVTTKKIPKKVTTNDFNKLPVYDINNVPVHILWIKDNGKYTGFIVSGHAKEEVCRKLSLALYRAIYDIRQKDSNEFNSYISFGIGYYLNKNITSNITFLNDISMIISSLKSKYSEVDEAYVVNTEVEHQKYWEYSLNIQKSIYNNQYESLHYLKLIRYNEDIPIIIPFYKKDVDKYDMVYFEDDIKNWKVNNTEATIENNPIFEFILELFIYLNDQKLLRFNELYNIIVKNENNIKTKDFNKILDITRDDKSIKMENYKLTISFKLVESCSIDDYGNLSVVYSKKNNNKVEVRYHYIDRYVRFTDKNKVLHLSTLISKIRKENVEICKRGLTESFTKVFNNSIDKFLVDAVLRGWPIPADNENIQSLYRKRNNILKRIIKDNIKLYSKDNVFFHIVKNKSKYKIYPMHLIGSKRVIVTSQYVGEKGRIQHVFTPYNFRNEKEE